MTKEEWKKSVIIGIVAGVVGAIMMLALLWGYIRITDWYKEYKRNTTSIEGDRSHCVTVSMLHKHDSICMHSRAQDLPDECGILTDSLE